MTAAREEILRRIRSATADVPGDEPPTWASAAEHDPAAAYRRTRPVGDAAGVFAERAAEYRAHVARSAPDGVRDAVAAACARHGARRLAVPADLPGGWLPEDVEPVADHDVATLDAVDGVLTGCAVAIAETGTIVLDAGAAQGPRRLTLVPDLHVCVVVSGQIVVTVPEALERAAGAVADGRPLTFVSGPSATSDIELDRVEGVHGPRRLEIVVVA